MHSAQLRTIRITGLVMLLLPVLALLILFASRPVGQTWFMIKLLELQDVWLLAGQVMIGALALAPVFGRLRLPVLSRSGIAGLAFGAVMVCYAGHYLVLAGYDLIRDEQMASFDAAIFAEGALAWPLPPEWRGEAGALNLTFMLPVEHPVAWVSAYLPGNAALRALVSQVADPALTGALLTGASLITVWSCARKLWPEDGETATLCAVLLLGSGQVMLSGMSAFAMPAHLLCNLVWLRLFLEDRRRTDLAAIALGLLATGLHQPLFHPLFVASFLLRLLRERRFARLGLFAGAYLAIGLFWMSWPLLTRSLVTGPGSVVAGTGIDYLSRLRMALGYHEDNLTIIGANLLRFVAWQHALAIPLALISLWSLRENRLAQAMAIGVALTIAVMAVILPWQGNGFGYRYLHGQLGSVALLAGFGWRWLGGMRAAARPVLARATVAGLALLLPAQMVMSHRIYASFARASAAIDTSAADYALIDDHSGLLGDTLVNNRADLSNRPLRLLASTVRDPVALAHRICRTGGLIVLGNNAFYRRTTDAFVFPAIDVAESRLPALKAPYERAGCRIRVID